MKTLFAILLTLTLLAVAGFAQPAITQVQNAASNAVITPTSAGDAPLPNAAIAPGSYFSIYGTGLGPSTAVYWSPYPLPTSLSGVSISVTIGSNATVTAYPEFVSAGQINAVLPASTATGTGTITVTYNGATSSPFNITVAAMSFGTFTWNEAGSGPGIFQNAVSYAKVTPFSTVAPGDYVTIWGTGLGASAASYPGGTEESEAPTGVNLCSGSTTCPVTVWVGGVQASVQFAGRSAYTAEDEVVFIVPSEAAVQGCYVQVAVQTASGASSIVGNFSSISVDPTGPTCSDADGMNYADISAAVTKNGGANVAAVSLLSNYLVLGPPLSLTWDNDTANAAVGTFSGSVLDLFQGFTLTPSVNNCTVEEFFEYPPPSDPGLSYVSYLNAGSALSIAGPNGTKPVPLNSNDKGYGALVGGETIANLILGSGAAPYYLNSSNAIVSGNYTLSGSGGTNVGSFSAGITVTSAAASFKWTNQAAITGSNISRSSPLKITWSGGDPNGYVDITAIASTLNSGLEPAKTTPGILVECIAPASTGSFSIPTYVLQSLPSTASSTSLVPPGELLVGPASVACSSTIATSTTCPSDVTLPSGLDALYLFYHFIAGSTVTWQ